MRIALGIHHLLSRDAGAPGVVLRLADEFRAMGHTASIFSFGDLPGKMPGKWASLSFPWFCASHLWRSAHEFDVLDFSSGDAWIYASTTRPARRPLLVTHSHGLEHLLHDALMEEVASGAARVSWKYGLYNGGLKLWEVAQSFRSADLALFLNRPELEYAAARLNVRSERARIVHNGIPNSLLGLPFRPTCDRERLRIVQVGSYIPRKGTRYGNEALRRVLLRYPNVEMTFLGTARPKEVVLADFPAMLHDRIQVVPGFDHDQLPELLTGAHIKLFPTLSEGFGLALLEAMACGLAPVTTATPGPLEIVRPDIDGLVVPPRDTEALESALRSLIEDSAFLDKLRLSARERAQEFSWARIARDRLALYEEFLERKRATSRVPA